MRMSEDKPHNCVVLRRRSQGIRNTLRMRDDRVENGADR